MYPPIKDERLSRPKPKQVNEVEAVMRSPTNMAAAKIVAADFNKMTSRYRRPASGHVCRGRSASANRRLQTLLLF